ncbi:MAG: DUF1501 domain-containing protein [Bryobacteraceae bacterium]
MRTRREFLKKCCSLGAAGATAHVTRLGLINANAQSASGYRALVCVFLFGGNDANNTIVPLDSRNYADYTRGRGPIALTAAQLLAIADKSGARPFGLHPQLAGLQQLYIEKRVAAVLNVGTLVKPTTKQMIASGQAQLPRNLYSHSDQTQQWQTSNPQGGGTGWGGRAADFMQFMNSATGFPTGISVNGNAAFLNGNSSRPLNVNPGARFGLDGFGDPEAAKARDAAMQQILTFNTGVQLITSANGILNAGIQNSQAINNAINAGTPFTTTFPATGLGNQLQQVARIIAARNNLAMNRQIFFCGFGGFDNHNDLLPSQADRFSQLGPALLQFYRATEELGVAGSVTTFTESEFSRTFNSNTGVGSDHAWGGHHFVLGGAVAGGDIYGQLPVLQIQGPDDAGDRGLWIPSTGLDQYGATLARWFGVQAPDLNTVFPNLVNFPSSDLGFLG